MTAAPLEVELHCPACGYDLRGSPSGVCPECGEAFQSDQLARTSIPWEHRSHYGFVRAFTRTIAQGLFDLGAFKSEVGREVSLRSALTLRWIVVGLVFIASAAAVAQYRYELAREFELQRKVVMSSATAFAGASSSWNDLPRELYLCTVSGWMALPTPFVAILLLLIGWSGVSSYFFQPRRLSEDQQITGLALSYYAAGPLVLLCAAIPIMCAGSWILMQGWIEHLASRRFAGALVVMLGGAIGAWAVLKSIFNSIVMLVWVVRPSLFAGVRSAAALVSLWLLVPIISLLVYPAAVGYLALMSDAMNP